MGGSSMPRRKNRGHEALTEEAAGGLPEADSLKSRSNIR